LQKVQCGALSAQQRAGIALQLQHHLVGGATLALLHMPGDLHGGVQRAQGGFGPGGAADHGLFARQDAGAGAAGGVNQAGGQVASAYVFGQGAGHVSLGQGRYVVVVHGEGRGL
jgi:hypothetical protein